MQWMLKPDEAIEMGFTHEGRYWGIPVYIGNLEFTGVEPIMVTTIYTWCGFLFEIAAWAEWLFTPPNAPSRFLIVGVLE